MKKLTYKRVIRPSILTENAYGNQEITKEDIIYAIDNRLLLKVYYEGGSRIIEPHCFGLANTNNKLLRAYQVSGHSTTRKLGWKLLNLNKIGSCEIQETNFRERHDYKRNDKDMKIIYSQL